ncbi:MAG: hypothetical protein K9H14_06010 [Actinomycetia bacterium]|nr:hypothetical protein [Actinomycetes bacterium]
MSKKPWPLHPFLFGLFPILFLYSQNMGQVALGEILIPSGIAMAMVALILAALWLLFKRNINKAGITATIAVILFFSYGHIYNMVGGKQLLGLVVGRHRYLVLIWILLLLVVIFLIVRTRVDLKNLTRVLNIVAVCLIAVSVVNISIFKINAGDTDWNVASYSPDMLEGADTHAGMDVYYIILDGYASSTTLKDEYGYDNSEFIHHLEQKGFYIASESVSNYPSSFLSLASSLNMEYINYLSDRLGQGSNDRSLPYAMIEQNKVVEFFKSHGYRYIHFSSGWGPTNYNQYADENVSVSQSRWSEFQTLLIQTTALTVFEKNFFKDIARMRVINNFEQLARVPGMEGSNFVFAHIVCPHPPYIFNRQGGPVPETDFDMDIWGQDQKDYYLDQLIYLNEEVKAFVDRVTAQSETPPIIILQADHGPRNTFIPDQYPSDSMFREGMRIFNAYYMPQQENDLLYRSITPVNSFRVVFNTYFGTSFPLLEDRSYNSFEVEPYRFTDITDTVTYK